MTKLGPRAPDNEWIQVDGTTLRLDLGWNRGEHYRHYQPLATMMLSTAVEDHILHGWLPEEPLIGRSTRVIAIGSCFAQYFANHLLRRLAPQNAAAEPHVMRLHAGMTTTFSIRRHLEWALEGAALDGSLWDGFDAHTLGFDEQARRDARERYLQAEVLVLTLGLSEIWEDSSTGEAFWRAIPRDRFDPDRHRFRVSTVAENLANLEAIYCTIRRHRPKAKIVLTLSPIPLNATFRPQSCISANSVSKAILRAAIDELWRRVAEEGHLYYWPSFEIVTEAFEKRFRENRRHIKGRLVTYIMLLFEKYYFDELQPDFEGQLLQAFIEARAVGGSYSFEVVEALDRRDLPWLRSRVRLACQCGHLEFIEPLVRRCGQLFPDEAEFPTLLTIIDRALGRGPGAGAEIKAAL